MSFNTSVILTATTFVWNNIACNMFTETTMQLKCILKCVIFGARGRKSHTLRLHHTVHTASFYLSSHHIPAFSISDSRLVITLINHTNRSKEDVPT